MKIIAGLGNPDRKYQGSRHNAGFEVIDLLSSRHGIPLTELKFKAMTGKGLIMNDRVMLVKPLTYMNLSGESIQPLMAYFGAELSDLIVIYDDISLDLGQIRVRARGSAGGHNGMKSIIGRLGSEEFTRIRLGVGGKPERMDLADYVLGHFSAEEKEIFSGETALAADAAELILSAGTAEAMNHFNTKKRTEEDGSI